MGGRSRIPLLAPAVHGSPWRGPSAAPQNSPATGPGNFPRYRPRKLPPLPLLPRPQPPFPLTPHCPNKDSAPGFSSILMVFFASIRYRIDFEPKSIRSPMVDIVGRTRSFLETGDGIPPPVSNAYLSPLRTPMLTSVLIAEFFTPTGNGRARIPHA